MVSVIYSIHSGNKIAHLAHCRFVSNIKKAYRRSFRSPREAFANGYRMCMCCCPSVETLWKKERPTLLPFLQKHKMSISVVNGRASIKTPSSEWLILQDGDSMRLSLYHKNTQDRRNEAPSAIPGYHMQESSHSGSLRGHLNFILSHDNYRRKHPDTPFAPSYGSKSKKNGVEVRQNGKVYRKNVQLRSDPDLSPWLTGSNMIAGGFHKTRFKKKYPRK